MATDDLNVAPLRPKPVQVDQPSAMMASADSGFTPIEPFSPLSDLTETMRSFDRIQLELLVLEAQLGDVAAFGELLRSWLPVMTRHAYRLTGDRDGAADVTQEACLAITRGLRRLDDPARFESWTLRIVTNKAADWVRRRQRQRRLQESLESREPRPPASDLHSRGETSEAERLELIQRALAQLPHEMRAVISLHYGEGLSVANMALALDVPPGTVKSRLHHARRRLRELVGRGFNERV
jgi:RNA polymerase sigma factor (sigma-70 family)